MQSLIKFLFAAVSVFLFATAAVAFMQEADGKIGAIIAGAAVLCALPLFMGGKKSAGSSAAAVPASSRR